MQLTQQARIEPTEKQKGVLWDISEKCRLIYNFALQERKENWKKNKDKSKEDREYITYTDQQNQLPKTKKKYSEYKWVYSKALQMTLRKSNADYKSFFALRKNGDEKARPPNFKGKTYFTTMYYNQSGFKIEKGVIKLSHNHPSGIELKFEIPDKFIFESVSQISIYQKNNDFYVSIIYKKRVKQYHDNGKYQAFDLGIMKHTGVNSEGKFVEFYNKRPYKYWKEKIQKIESKRDKCKKGSNRWKCYHKKLNKMIRKCANQTKDFQHKQTKKIIENTKANTIIVGKINVKKMNSKNKRQKRLHYSTHNTGFLSRTVRFLSYKAEINGKRIIEISEINTTKTCCVCGKKQGMPLHKRTYQCDYGNVIDRDKNSSVNHMKRFLSQERSVNEQSSVMEGFLRQTVKHKEKSLPNLGCENPQEAIS